ncbi:MAG TPA: hypothetical protein VNG51_19885 [Ktedonobacteraceae bacterium]|nr:hypothetical protein [Ktedonobacteraceae bacterium]
MSSIRGLIIALLFLATGIIFLFISLASLGQTGNTVQTPLYVQGCIVADVRATDNSFQQLELGYLDNQGHCTDTGNGRVGYQITTGSLAPSLSSTITSGVLPTVEVWYKPHLTPGVCGSDKHPCQIADVLALRTYMLNRQNTVVPAVLYKSEKFSIKGDLTQAHYNPRAATYLKEGVSIWLPVLFLLAGLLLISGAVLLMLDYRKRQGKVNMRKLSSAL